MRQAAGQASAAAQHAVRATGLALVAVAAGALLLGWTLSRGPVPVPFLAGVLERLANRQVAAAGGTPSGARFSIGEAALGWDAWHHGLAAPLQLRLDQVRLMDSHGLVHASVGAAAAVLPLGPLLHGDVTLLSLRLDRPMLQARRDESGALAVDLAGLASKIGPGGGASASPADTLQRWTSPPDGTGLPGPLQLVQLEDGLIAVQDRQLGRDWSAEAIRISLRRGDDGVWADAAARLRVGDAAVPLQASATAEAGRGVELRATVPALRPADLARQALALAPLADLDTTLALKLDATLDTLLRPGRLHGEVSAGAGTAGVGDAARVGFRSIVAEVDGTADSLRVPKLVVQLAPRTPAPQSAAAPRAPTLSAPTLSGTVDARRNAETWRGKATLALDQLALADLDDYWPVGLGTGARDWLTENLTAGTARNGRWQAEAELPEGGAAPRLLGLSGTLDVAGATVHWLRPVPPMNNVAGTVQFGADEVVVRARGRQSGGAVEMRAGTLRFAGFNEGPGSADIQLDLAGPIPDVLALLKQPRLHLFDRRPLEIHDASGTLTGHLSIAFPLLKDLPVERLRLGATAQLAEVRLPNAVLGRNVEHGQFDLSVNTESLHVSGPAQVGGVPARLGVEMDFRPGPATQVVERDTVSTRLDAADVTQFGLDPTRFVQGPLGLDATAERRRGGDQSVDLHADLGDARLRLEEAGYSKPPGQPAAAAATLTLRRDHLRSVDNIAVDGPALRLRGNATLRNGKSLDRLVLTDSVINNSNLSAEARAPATPNGEWRIAARGPVLDLEPLLSHTNTGNTAAGGGTAVAVDARFERVRLGGERQLLGVVAALRSDAAGVVQEARATGRSGPRGGFEFALVPTEGGRRDLRLVSENGGELLSALDLSDTVHGGRLLVTGSYGETRPDASLAGHVSLTNFNLSGTATVGKVLQALTVYGLVDVARAPGLAFSRLDAPFTLSPGMLTLGESRAFSSSLGVTAHGQVNRRAKRIDLSGTIVPAYALNTALGRLPLVGRLFSPERGGGLFSVGYRVRGNSSDPSVTVNPLTAITPGALRMLFGGFAQGAGSGAAEEAPAR